MCAFYSYSAPNFFKKFIRPFSLPLSLLQKLTHSLNHNRLQIARISPRRTSPPHPLPSHFQISAPTSNSPQSIGSLRFCLLSASAVAHDFSESSGLIRCRAVQPEAGRGEFEIRCRA
uniref:Uncharacterized protein n=1 Tax=Kalanchoe fedtschenkoi TaxID=63787 RepID=A0A7N0VNB8_KALFE